MQPSSPPLGPASIARFSSPSIIPDTHTAAMLVLVNKPETHSYPVFHVQRDPPPNIQAKSQDGDPITAYDQIVIGSDYDSDLRMFFAEPRHCSLIVDELGKIHILNFSGDNPCQLNSSPLPTGTLRPLTDMDVIHVAGKDFRVEYKPGYPIEPQPQDAAMEETSQTQPLPCYPKILSVSSSVESIPYTTPPMPATPEQFHFPPETEEISDSLPTNISANMEILPVQEASSPGTIPPSAEDCPPLAVQALQGVSPAPSPRRIACHLDATDNSSASMECNTTQQSMLVKDISTMDDSVDNPDKRRRTSDIPKKTISSPIKLKRRSAPVQPLRRSTRNMDTSTDSDVRRRSPRIQVTNQDNLTPKPTTPASIRKKPLKNSKQPTSTPQSSRKSTSPLASSSLKSVRFGPKLSPEEFDRRLPPSTPIKRGATPRSATKSVLRRSTPYKVPVPLCSDLGAISERRSTSLSPRLTPAGKMMSPVVGKRYSPLRNLKLRPIFNTKTQELIKQDKPMRLQKKGLGSRLLKEISESHQLRTSNRISTPTSITAKGTRLPKPLQSGLGAKKLMAASQTSTASLGGKSKIESRNPKSPEKSLKLVPEFTISVDLERSPESRKLNVAGGPSRSPKDKDNKTPELVVTNSPASNPEPTSSMQSPKLRGSLSPKIFYKSQDSSPELQTPSMDGSRQSGKSPSRKSIDPVQSRSTPSPRSPKRRGLSPKTPTIGPRDRDIEHSRTPTSRPSSRRSVPPDDLSPTNSRQNDTLPSTPQLRSRSLSTSRQSLGNEPLISPSTKSPSTRAMSPQIELQSPGTSSKSPRVSTFLSPPVGSKSRVSASTKSPLSTSLNSESIEDIPAQKTPTRASITRTTPKSAATSSRDRSVLTPRTPGSRSQTPKSISNFSPQSEKSFSEKNTPTSIRSRRSIPPRSEATTPGSYEFTSVPVHTPPSRVLTPRSTTSIPRPRNPSSTTESPLIANYDKTPNLVPNSTKSTPTPTPRTPKYRATTPGSRSSTPAPLSNTPKSTPRVPTPTSRTATPISPAPYSHTATPDTRSHTPIPRAGTPNIRSPTPIFRAGTPISRIDTPSTRSRTPIPRIDTPSTRSRTPIPRTATPNIRSRTPIPRAATPNIRSRTPISRTATPTRASGRVSSVSPSSDSNVARIRGRRSGSSTLSPFSPPSSITDVVPSPREAWQSPDLKTRSLTPRSASLSKKRIPVHIDTPRPRSSSVLRREDMARLFKTPKEKHRTSQPEANFRASLFNISESESMSPQQSSTSSKRSQSLPGRNLRSTEQIPRKKNTAPAEDNFNPYMFRSPRSKSLRTRLPEDNFNPHMFRSPRPKRQPAQQERSEDNFDPELFRSPPTPSLSGGRGAKRQAAKQTKLPAKVSKSDEVSVEVSPLKIRETRRMLREKQTASSRAVKRRSDSDAKSSPVKVLLLDSPTPVQPKEPSPAAKRHARNRIASPAASPTLSSPTPVRVARQKKTDSPLAIRRRTRSKAAYTISPVPVEIAPAPVRAQKKTDSPPTIRRRTRSKAAYTISPAPVRATRQKKTDSPLDIRRRTRSKAAYIVSPVPVEISPAPVRVTRQRKPAPTKGDLSVETEPKSISPAPAKRSLRNNRTVSRISKETKSILKTPSKRQKFSEKASPSLKLTDRRKVLTKSTHVNFASPGAIPAGSSPPVNRQKNSRKLRSEVAPKIPRVTRQTK